MKDLIKKQDEELTNIILYLTESDRKDICGNYKNNAVIDYGRLKSFISKVRKETAEKVCDRMIEEKQEIVNGDDFQKGFYKGLNTRIKEEKELKQQILKEL